jgi:hypothetical protein
VGFVIFNDMGQRLIITEEDKKRIRGLYEQVSSPDKNMEFFQWKKDNNVKFQTVVSPNPYKEGMDMKIELVSSVNIPKQYISMIQNVTEYLTAFSSDGKMIAQIVGGDGVAVTTLQSIGVNGITDKSFYHILKPDTKFVQDILNYSKGKEGRVFITYTPRPVSDITTGAFYKANPAILVIEK